MGPTRSPSRGPAGARDRERNGNFVTNSSISHMYYFASSIIESPSEEEQGSELEDSGFGAILV